MTPKKGLFFFCFPLLFLFVCPSISQAMNEPKKTDEIFNIIEDEDLDETQKLKKIEELKDLVSQIKLRDPSGNTPLQLAARYGYTTIVNLLFKYGAGIIIDAQNLLGSSALHVAAKNGNVDIVKVLIINKADINKKDLDGLTAFHWACRRGYQEVVKLLLEQGADINEKDNEGLTGLFWAILRDHGDVIAFLIDKGADVFVINKFKETALHFAAFAGNIKLITVLVKKGCDVNAKDEQDLTPVNHALDANKLKAVASLIEYGAKLDAQDKEVYLRKTNNEKLREYAENMQYPLTKEKLQWMVNFAKETRTEQMLALLDEFEEQEPREEYIQRFCKRLQRVIDKSDSALNQLNRRYKAELEAKRNDYLRLEMRTLYHIRSFFLQALLGNSGARVRFSAKEPKKYTSWFWFYSIKKDKRAPSRSTSQELIKLLAKNNWDETLLEKDKLYELLEDIPAGWRWKKFLAHFYKIHLMPKPEHMYDVLTALCALSEERKLDGYVGTFKVAMTFAAGTGAAAIVIYVNAPKKENVYKKNAQVVLDKLLKVTKAEWGTGRSPRCNHKINDLIFCAQGDGQPKIKNLKTVGTVFEAPEYAFYRPDWVGDIDLDFNLTVKN